MTQETNTVAHTSAPSGEALPKNLPIELLPVYDWWKTNGSQFAVTLTTAAILLAGAWAFKEYRQQRISKANAELLQASSLEDLETAVAKYGSTKAGNATRLRLAKAYFDAANYEEALNTYNTCLKKGAPAGFAEIATLGRAQALEGLNQLDEALAAYEAFDKESAGHFLQPQAKMGIARIYALQGKKDEAKKLLENLKAQKTGNATWEMAIANLEGVVDRYEPRAARSLFDAADAAAKAVSAPNANAGTQAPAVQPVAIPAPAAKK